MERQRAARGAVSCLLPAPDGDTQFLGGSPVNKRGSGGRRDRALLNAREPPPAVFWFLLHRCKRNSPAGEISTSLSETCQSGRMISAPTKAECQIRQADAIRPHPPKGKLPAAGGRRPPLRKKGKHKGEGEGSICPILFLRAQKRNEVSHKVLCQAFFQESGQESGSACRAGTRQQQALT